MSFPRKPSALISFWLLGLLPACYAFQTADSEQAAVQSNVAAAGAGQVAPSAAPSGQASPPSSAAAGQPTKQPTNAAGPAQTGAGGCAAILGPNASVTADTSAFMGIGGAGFELVGVCDRCGWSHQADNCRSLVYSVPTIDGADYDPCWNVSFEWVECVQKLSCICDGTVPAACQEIKDRLDACRR
jgi:hypothetical protein